MSADIIKTATELQNKSVPFAAKQNVANNASGNK